MAKKHWIYIKRGLSEDPKHRERIGQAIWCFMHIIDRADWETGIVYDWRDKDEAVDMGVNVRTLREWRRTLDENNYITCKQEQHGQQIVIHNWLNPRNYSGEVMNQLSQGDSILEPQGYIQGDTQGSRKDVTPTYDSKSKTWKQQRAEAKERVDKQRAERDNRDPIIETLKAAQDNAPLLEMRLRVETALNLNLSREWDLPKSDWYGYDRTLLQRERETGETIERFMNWYNEDDFRREGNIWLKPNKIEMFWRKAFSGNSKHDDVEELYPTL